MHPKQYQYDLDKQRAADIVRQAKIARAGESTGNGTGKTPRVALAVLLPVWYTVGAIARLIVSGIIRFRG